MRGFVPQKSAYLSLKVLKFWIIWKFELFRKRIWIWCKLCVFTAHFNKVHLAEISHKLASKTWKRRYVEHEFQGIQIIKKLWRFKIGRVIGFPRIVRIMLYSGLFTFCSKCQICNLWCNFDYFFPNQNPLFFHEWGTGG